MAIRPIRRFGFRTRRQGIAVMVGGVCFVMAGYLLPAHEQRITDKVTRLDQFVPVWEFSEFHEIKIAAPPERVYAAVKSVQADEIALFNALTWIRRGGRELPESILNAGVQKPLLDVATQSNFIWLADEAPRELVIGTIIAAPPRVARDLTPALFRKRVSHRLTLAAMNFAVHPDGSGGSIVSTETRVHANNPASRRAFAVYWRLIYPGSAIIRRMWLRAVERRAMAAMVSLS